MSEHDNIDDLFGGESDCIEYKRSRPKDATKYLKSVIAFSNGRGGKIVFGVDDKSLEVVGVPRDVLYLEQDAIANVISDSCAPTIVPHIYVKAVGDKSCIVVSVPAGNQVPYYLKSQGYEKGVFVRVGATSRPADLDYVRNIMIENSPRGFDRTPNPRAEVTDERLSELCEYMKATAIKNAKNDEQRRSVRDVTVNQLVKWGVLNKGDEGLVPTNAYSMLTGDGGEPFWSVRCAVFRGKGRRVFIDRREFTGSVIDQVESAYEYVLSKINMGANFDHLQREDVYEIPTWSIRELVTNAVLHRSYQLGSSIKVSLFDDRLEIRSPGGLVRGLSLAGALSGESDARNKALAMAFQYMNLIENWGTGLGRVVDELTDFGLADPEFEVSNDEFCVGVQRMTLDEFGEKLHPTIQRPFDDASGDGAAIGGDRAAIERRLAAIGGDRAAIERRLAAIGFDRAVRIIAEAETAGSITTADVAELFDLKPTRAREIVGELTNLNLLEKVGTGRYTRYFPNMEA